MDDSACSRSVSESGTTCFADRIKTLIDTYGSATYIARTCGFSEGVVRSWRDGRSDPSRERCVVLARRLGVSLLWVIAGEGSMWDGRQPASADSTTRIGTDTPPDNGRIGMNASQLSAAMRTLRSSLELAGGDSRDLSQHADLLAGYYTLMGQTDPLLRAETLTALNRRLAQRVREATPSAA